MAWRRPGDKPLSEPMVVRLPTHICVTRPQWVKSFDVQWWLKRYHYSSAFPTLCEGNPPVTCGFPSQRVSNMESISMSLHHHGIIIIRLQMTFFIYRVLATRRFQGPVDLCQNKCQAHLNSVSGIHYLKSSLYKICKIYICKTWMSKCICHHVLILP